MITGADIESGINTLTSTLSLLNRLKDLTENAKSIETKEIITNLRSDLGNTKSLLIDAKLKIVSLEEENISLHEEIRKIKLTKEIEPELIVKNNLYYKADNDGPFCSSCFDSKKQLNRMYKLGSAGYKCPSCKGFSSR